MGHVEENKDIKPGKLNLVFSVSYSRGLPTFLLEYSHKRISKKPFTVFFCFYENITFIKYTDLKYMPLSFSTIVVTYG